MGQSTSVSAEASHEAAAPKAAPKPALRAARNGPPEPTSPSMLQQAMDAVVGRRLEEIVEVSSSSKPLGSGAFGTVWRGRYLDGGCAVAVKSLDKAKMKQMKVPDTLVTAEVEFMRECKGQPWFVQLYDFLDTRDKFYLLLELCNGGNMEDAARSLDGGLSEARCAAFISQLLSGIAFLHSRKICHRDVKPQNAMLLGDVRDTRSQLRLGDFGIAVRLTSGQLLTEKLGTPAFMAPEMHMLPKSNGYDCKVDLWAAGTFMVFLLSLEYPFVDPSGRLLKNDLLRGDLPIWEGNAFQSLFRNVQEAAGLRRKRPSPVARDLVRRLLRPKRTLRPEAEDALKHPWFRAPQLEAVDDREEEVADPLLQWADFEAERNVSETKCRAHVKRWWQEMAFPIETAGICPPFRCRPQLSTTADQEMVQAVEKIQA
ncbi:PEPKR2 [Symbiodinium natans]|uniref:PEPKR2 protein n=1 Tax=Symbiodinium natans TaxID=878477 RepID=A0A812UIR1_9DINO|nr:PEPKR2 [Symbiodinium natans]